MSLNFIMQKYRILGKKGEGTFSEVLKCQNIQDGTYFACKKMKQHYESLEQVNNLREIQAMRRLSPHANILELTEVLFDKKSGTLVLICELMDMNIYELIRERRDFFTDYKMQSMMKQILTSIETGVRVNKKGLAIPGHNHPVRNFSIYYHINTINGIFHRDVKPENILIKDDLLKLADFGSCRSVYSKQPYTEYISTRWYRAPECLLTDGFYTYKMDIWSVGCVMFEIMSLHPLFPGSNEVDQIAKIHDIMGTPDPSVLTKLRNKTRGMNFNFPQKKGSGIEKLLPHAPTDSIDLIYQLCAYDPEERISAKQALRHTYFRELRSEEKRNAAIKAKKEKEKKEQEKRLHDEKNNETNEDLTDLDQTDTQSTKTETNNKEAVDLAEKQKRRREREKLKEKENNLKELSSKYKLDPIERLKEESEKENKKNRSPRPDSGSSTVTNNTVRYPGSILHGRDPVYGYHKRERKRLNQIHPAYLSPFAPHVTIQRNYFDRKQRKKNRVTESGPEATGTFLPRVAQINKPSTFQPSFHTSAYGQTTNLPKLGATSTTSTYLPSLTQAFVKPNKSKAAKNIYGSYHLPTIDRRGEGY